MAPVSRRSASASSKKQIRTTASWNRHTPEVSFREGRERRTEQLVARDLSKLPLVPHLVYLVLGSRKVVAKMAGVDVLTPRSASAPVQWKPL